MEKKMVNQSFDGCPQTRNKKGIKKKIIVLICAVLALIIFMFVAVIILENISKGLEQEEKQYDFDFYEADYGEDIFTDEEYLELIENNVILFCNMDNVTVGITEEDAHTYGGDVEFMVKYVKYMTYGEVDNYNNCYSELYYTVEEPKENFTMQKIYNVDLVKVSQNAVAGDNGEQYNEYIFTLSYQILKNNGTLRDDFLTGTKKQYILVTDREGDYKIDGISTAQIRT